MLRSKVFRTRAWVNQSSNCRTTPKAFRNKFVHTNQDHDYSLPPEIDSLVQQKLASGTYASEEAVLRAALSALDEHEETVGAISQGYDDLHAGRYQSLGDADREFRKRHNISREA